MEKTTYIPYGACLLGSNSIHYETLKFYDENIRLATQSLREYIPSIAMSDITYLYFLTARQVGYKEDDTSLYASWGILVFAIAKDKQISSCEIKDFDTNLDEALNAISILLRNAVSPSTLSEILDDIKA